MFDECTQLNEVWLDNTYNTYNNISMNYMFNECTSLKKVNLENFNVFAIGMFCMFKNCSSLKELNISTINTELIFNMSYMFYECRSLNKIIHNFNTNNVVHLKYMFYECENLEEIDLSNFNIPKRSKMKCMFSKCKLESNYINTALEKSLAASNLSVEKLTKKVKPTSQ